MNTWLSTASSPERWQELLSAVKDRGRRLVAQRRRVPAPAAAAIASGALVGLTSALLARRSRPAPSRTLANLAAASAAVAVGALALGAVSVGALAIARLAVRSAHIKRLRIDVLEVGQQVGGPVLPAPSPS